MRAHDFCAPGNMVDVFDQLGDGKFRHIQLALAKSITDYDFSYGHYSSGFAHYIGGLLKARGLHVAVLGCYINPVLPDETLRMAEVNRFIEHLKYAKRMNADMVGTETGRYSLNMSVTPKTETEECYRLLLDSFSKIAEAAESLGVTIGVEGVYNHTLSTPEKMSRFLYDLASPNIEVILDTANLISPQTTEPQKQDEIIDKAFEYYGDRITLLHLKDCVFTDGMQDCRCPGTGLIQYNRLMKHVKNGKPEIIGLLEESSREDFTADCQFFKQQFDLA